MFLQTDSLLLYAIEVHPRQCLTCNLWHFPLSWPVVEYLIWSLLNSLVKLLYGFVFLNLMLPVLYFFVSF